MTLPSAYLTLEPPFITSVLPGESSEATLTASGVRPVPNDRYKKCRPSGRNAGHQISRSPALISGARTIWGVPPDADTRRSAPSDAPRVVENRITPSAFQSAPTGVPT